MRRTTFALLLPMSLALAAIAGCGRDRERVVVYEEQRRPSHRVYRERVEFRERYERHEHHVSH